MTCRRLAAWIAFAIIAWPVRTAAQLPGDPTTQRGSPLGWGEDLEAGRGGILYAAASHYGIWRFTAAGSSQRISTSEAADIVVDGLGDILYVLGGPIMRLNPLTGAESVFFGGGESGFSSVTVGPDGHVWATSYGTGAGGPHLYELDPYGAVIDSIPAVSAGALAFSPSGRLHLVDGYDVLRLGSSGLEIVVPGVPWRTVRAIAFDAAGAMYLSTWTDWFREPFGIVKVDSTYVTTHDPIALDGVGFSNGIAFALDADGVATNALFVLGLDSLDGRVRRLNPAGVTHAGFRVGSDLFDITTTELRHASVGRAYADTLEAARSAVWSVTEGNLPDGMQLSAAGVLTGTPAVAGEYSFGVTAAAGTLRGSRRFTLRVNELAVAGAVDHLLGGGHLSRRGEEILDEQGNGNGEFDVGDLRALIEERGLLPQSP